MRRREFLGVFGSAAAMPLVAHAQQRERMRRIGVLMHLAADDPEAQARNAAFLQGPEALGWSVGRNVRIDTRWVTDPDLCRKNATELVALSPDVLVATTTVVVRVAARHPNYPDRVFQRHRCSRLRIGHEPCSAWQQRDRLHPVRVRHQRKVAGTAQAVGARHDARRGPS